MKVDGPQTRLYRGKSARQPEQRGCDRRIAELAEQQHGVVALWQLVEMGLNDRLVDKRVAMGRLHSIHQGVYAVGHRLLSADGHRMAAVIACGPHAVLSHRSAAALWGLRRDSRNRLDVTAPGRRGRAPIGIDAHRDGSLKPADRTEIRGIPCTSVARTLLDLAAVASPHELRNAVTQAEVERVFDLISVRELIGRSRRRRGVARLRRAVAEHDVRDERTRGELERSFLALCRKGELPLPEVNVLLTIGGVKLEADFLWRDARLVIETDDRRSHLTVTAFEKDRRRDQQLKVAGWEVVRCTWRQVTDDPIDLARILRTLLSRRPHPSHDG
jgi:very-short-patch-repair endonuclease/predicted transcriptional regulator of viral defense system